jgi:hypothetical protein
VVLLADSLTPAQLETVQKELLSLYTALRGHPFRLAVVRNGALGFAGPFTTRTQLGSALSGLAEGSDAPASGLAVSPEPSVLLDNLSASAVKFGADWSRVLLVGELPLVDASVRDYASGLLLRAFGDAHLCVSWFAFSGGDDGWAPLFQATGGAILRGSLSDFSHAVTDLSQSYFQVDWAAPTPLSGFVLSRSALSDSQAQRLLEIPDLAVPAGATLPTIEQYAILRGKTIEAARLLSQEDLTDAASKTIRDDVQAALQINPRDPEALLAGAAFYERIKDYSTAAHQRAVLTEVRPFDPAGFAALGRALVLASDFDAAEAALERAAGLKLRTPQMAADFARIRLARNDDRGALPYLAESLSADPKQQDLWFLQAQAAERLTDSALAIRSFEEGLALGGVHPAEGTSLIRLYLATGQKQKASELARAEVAALPPQPDVREQFAGSLDDLRLSAEALAAWKRVLEVRADSGRAHVRIAQLLLDRGDISGAEQAANVGLAAAPTFPALYVVKADILEKAGSFYEARKVLEQGAEAVRDAALLSRLAATEDSYGGLAAGAYEQLGAALDPASPERLKALQRGLAVSVRDADSRHIQSFTSLLASSEPARRNVNDNPQPVDSGSLIPGGLDALAFSAHAKEGVPPERFLVEYCRTLIDRIPEQPNSDSKRYVDAILEHFERIAALEALGKQDGSRTVITLSTAGKDANRRTERALSLLGLRLRTSKGEVELDRGEKKGQAKKQETASALAIDEVGLQEALSAGKPYNVEILNEWAPVYPSERLWREAFYAKENEPGGIATALLRMPRMARLYVGMSYLDRTAVSALLSTVNLATLEQRYADLIYLYSPALAIEEGHALVPGGRKAETAWASLAGVSPAQPGAFFRALLEQNNGKLLAFFFALSQLDRQHQEFFTASQARTLAFYKFFAESDETRRKVSLRAYDSAFAQFLRSVPLDPDGHVDFPGSPEVWMVAKGRSSGEAQVAKMMRRVSRAAAPDVEDDLLLHLAQTRYKENFARHSELENFLSVARIDLHRPKPMDEQSALLLAQNYANFSAAYPYLAEITGLSYSDYLQFFSALERIKTHSVLETNLQLGQFHSLIEWICLLHARGLADDGTAAKLFKFTADKFAAADSPAGYTQASLESARTMLEFCKSPEKNASPDDRILRCFVGLTPGQRSKRSIDFQRILELQKAPTLDGLFAIYDGLANLNAQGAAEIGAIKKAADGLPLVELPKGSKIIGKEKEGILRYEPAPAQKAVAELTQKLSKKKLSPKDIEKNSQELLGELQPQVTLALASKVYAYFLRSSDLVVSEDPLFLRKHRYFDFVSEEGRKQLLPESNFERSSEGIGSYFQGGFAEFSLAAGKAASVGWKTGGPGGSESVAAQVAVIRSAAWDHLLESDQRLVSLRITVAREWIYMSAAQPEVFRALSEETMGVLSLSRRADLLNGIEAANWRKVWDSVTLPDLFLLGGRYLERFKTDPWSSPLTSSLRSLLAANDGSRLYIFGTIPYRTLGCSHLHLVADAPYEEYERQMLPEGLAERSAEFKLYLAFQADIFGVEPSALSDVAEALASKAFRGAQMMDSMDWRSLLAGFGTINSKDVKQALEQ